MAAGEQEGSSPSDVWQADVVASMGGPPPPPAQPPRRGRAIGKSPCLRPGCPLLPPTVGWESGTSEQGKQRPQRRGLGRWEHQSHPLAVRTEAKAALAQLLPYLEGEVAALGDESMQQEVVLLQKLARRE